MRSARGDSRQTYMDDFELQTSVSAVRYRYYTTRLAVIFERIRRNLVVSSDRTDLSRAEKRAEPQNRIPYSEDLTAWLTVGSPDGYAANGRVHPNAAIAPDGTPSADQFVEDRIGVGSGGPVIMKGGEYRAYVGYGAAGLEVLPPGTDVVYSEFYKSAGRSWLTMNIFDGNPENDLLSYTHAHFDIVNGVAGGAWSNLERHSPGTHSGVASVGNGWFRCWVRRSLSEGKKGNRAYFEVYSATHDFPYDDTEKVVGGKSFHSWGRQVEYGVRTPGGYTKTGSSPVTASVRMP